MPIKKLATYRAKRDFAKTKEPSGSQARGEKACARRTACAS